MKRNFPKNEEHEEAYLAEKKAMFGDVVDDLEESIKKENRLYRLMIGIFILGACAIIGLFVYLKTIL